MPAEPLLEGQTQDLVDKLVLVVLLVHKVVNLGLVVLAVQVAVEGMGNLFEHDLRKDLQQVLGQVSCLYH